MLLGQDASSSVPSTARSQAWHRAVTPVQSGAETQESRSSLPDKHATHTHVYTQSKMYLKGIQKGLRLFWLASGLGVKAVISKL